MQILHLRGTFRREHGYLLIKMKATELADLARLVRETADQFSSAHIYVGSASIVFSAGPFPFSVALDGDVLKVSARQGALRNLASRIDHMVDAEVSPDYLVHVHLDNDIDSIEGGITDVVFQRIDRYHR